MIDLIRAAARAGRRWRSSPLLVFFGLVRPAVKSAVLGAAGAARPRAGTRIDAVVDDERRLRRRSSPRRAYLRQIEGAQALAKDNPAAVAGIVRGWVGGGEAA